MRVPRFFARRGDLHTLQALLAGGAQAGAQIELVEEDLLKQVRAVLRLSKGDRLILLDGEGSLCECEIERIEKRKLACRLLKRAREMPEKRTVLKTALALIKPHRFEWCIEKLTELGVGEIIPVLSSRCVGRLDLSGKSPEEKLPARLSRWQAIAREAAEQSERCTIPNIVMPLVLEQYLSRPTSGGITELRYICRERGDSPLLAKALGEQISAAHTTAITGIDSISLLVGPEGGFSEEELLLAEKQGWQPVSLGPRILRSETAAIAAMSQVASVLDI